MIPLVLPAKGKAKKPIDTSAVDLLAFHIRARG
jgi:hypothetical protein